jgi:uncharacterized protein
MAKILMPQATAVWLIDNTSLTFEQVADFCELHRLEVKSIADGEAHTHMRGVDPIAGGELTREEIAKGEADPDYRLKLKKSDLEGIAQPKRKGARYTPVSRRADKPDAIAWFIRHHPEVPDSQISKLIGTTKNTINAVRNKEHWNAQNIKPVDPVTLGLCSQIELDEVIGKAAAKRQEMIDRKEIEEEGPGLKSVEDSLGGDESEADSRSDQDLSIEDVFRNFKG